VDFTSSKKKVAALTEPRNVVVVGASDRPGSWALRAHRNLKRYGFPGPVYLFNPRRTELLGETCYQDFKALPEPPDHLLVVVPAPAVAETLRAGAAAGARSATIFSSGFGEAFDEEGAALGRELRTAIAETGLGVSGPNCMGNICAKTSFVTLTEDRPLSLRKGPVALVGQSGGVMIFINSALEERGIAAEYLITSGNEAGLSVADYIAFFADQPELKVVIVYVEAIKDVAKFRAACLAARAAGKHVIAVKLGQSEAGRSAAMAHTGSLAGSIEAFDAVAGDFGVIRVDTIDDAVEITELLTYTGPTGGRRIGAITLSGAYRGLLLDAAEKNNMQFPPLSPETLQRLDKVLGVGSLIGNPIDGGFGVLTSSETYLACIEALQDDPNLDMILLQESLPREAGSQRAEKYMDLVENYNVTNGKKPIAFVTLASHSQTNYSRDLRKRAPHVSFLQEANKALRVIERVARRSEREKLAAATAASPPPSAAQRNLIDNLRRRAKEAKGAFALNEAQSKDLLRAYGFPTPREEVVNSPDAAAAAAARIGFPVVLKAVSATLLHKSDVGAVMLNLKSADEVRAAYQKILDNLAAHKVTDPLDGVLVGQMVGQQTGKALELVLGLHRDPEMGLVVMAGSGGVLLELFKDVAFSAPPLSREKALDMLDQTHAARLLRGYRGSAALDIDAIADALVALGRIAIDGADLVQSIDINPVVALPQGQGAVALDALVIIEAKEVEA
jgi:acyl-CoA synthetase (NDP forming)